MLNFQTSQLIQFQCTIFVFMFPYIWRCLLPKMPLIDHKRSLTFSLNSSRPSDIYMHHWPRPSLIQTETIYIYCLFGAEPLSKPMLDHCKLNHKEYTQMKFKSNNYLSIQEKSLKNIVCKILAMFVKDQTCQCISGNQRTTIRYTKFCLWKPYEKVVLWNLMLHELWADIH